MQRTGAFGHRPSRRSEVISMHATTSSSRRRVEEIMRNIIVGCASVLALGAVAGCERKPTDPGNIPPGSEVGMLRVYLGSDTAADQLDPRVDEVWVRIDSVE